ncbi:hypothetical protein C0995_009443 [Termitomyces sp. Mi166|nr:hypothetical protein C0995_009443 [Termitomyces sp. Mi166\
MSPKSISIMFSFCRLLPVTSNSRVLEQLNQMMSSTNTEERTDLTASVKDDKLVSINVSFDIPFAKTDYACQVEKDIALHAENTGPNCEKSKEGGGGGVTNLKDQKENHENVPEY